MKRMLSLLRGGVGESPATGLYAMGTRLTGAAVSVVGGVLILALLDPERIGVFLSFTSLTGFSIIADLGLTYSFLLAASARTPEQAAPIASAALTLAIPTVVVTGTILFVGGAMFMLKGEIDQAEWLWPWLAYCVISSIQQVLVLGLTYVEGTGRRHEAWRANFWIEVVAAVPFIALIALGAELWAVAAGALVRSALILALFLWHFDLPPCDRDGSRLALWREQLWPMQWKTVVNNGAGLLTTRLLTPVLLATQGAATAGQVGLILAFGYIIMATTSVWPLSQTALYAQLYHQGSDKELSGVFRRTFVASSLVAAMFALGAGALCEILRMWSPHAAARLPTSPVIWLILATAPLGHLSACFATALRAQRRDPVVIANAVLAIPILFGLWLAARHSVMTFSTAYLSATIAFTLLYAYYFFGRPKVPVS